MCAFGGGKAEMPLTGCDVAEGPGTDSAVAAQKLQEELSQRQLSD
jgi:hypothetical protein